MKPLRLVLLLPALIAFAAAALADEGVDIDAMKERYKNMPGGEMMIQQLEAHRAEIEAANKKAHAQAVKNGIAGPYKPLSEIMTLVPPAPKNVAEARSRKAKVPNPNGTGPNVEGDAKSTNAQREFLKFMQGSGYEALNGRGQDFGAHAVVGEQKEAIQLAARESKRISTAAQELHSSFLKDASALKSQLEQKITRISEAYSKKIDGAHCGDPGTPAATCPALAKARFNETQAARQEYLDSFSGKASDFQTKAKTLIGEGEAVQAKVKKGFEGGKILGAAAQMLHGIDTNNALLIGDLLSSLQDATVAASYPDPRE